MAAAILAGRSARCACGKIRPSDETLAFFEYRGDGSHDATETCKHCRYFKVAHKPGGNSSVKGYRNRFVCAKFEPMGASEFDAYYCGHGGWD